MRKILAILFILLIALLPILSVTPASAIAQPSSPLQIVNSDVFQLADGGLGVLVEYYIDYAVLPTETATQAYLVNFVDTDGISIRKSVAPFAFVDSGYNYGVVWLQFTAAEVATYSLYSTNAALYKLWITGNPSLTWAAPGTPPSTYGSITTWHTTGDVSSLIASSVRYYASLLSTTFSLALQQTSANGYVLTANGETYFVSVIPSLHTLAPAVFSAGTVTPVSPDITYTTSFGAIVAGTIVVGTPVTLVSGSNSINTTGAGTFTVTCNQGTSGTIANGTGTGAGLPASVVAGVNTVTVTAGGTFTIVVSLNNTTSQMFAQVGSTNLDVTAVATVFGMSRGALSTIIWMLLGVLFVAAVFGISKKNQFDTGQNSKTMFFFYGIWCIGGILLGMIMPIVGAIACIAFGGFIGYIIFFRYGTGDVGRQVSFCAWMLLVTSIAGGMMMGTSPQASTILTADITSTSTTIPVSNTIGFSVPGTAVIGTETIAYSKVTSTTLEGTVLQPLVRGATSTTAASHVAGSGVRQPVTAMFNDSLSFSLAEIADSSGIQAFVTVPVQLFNMLKSLFFLPLDFLGTDFAILTLVWGVFALGTLVTLFILMAGGRRV